MKNKNTIGEPAIDKSQTHLRISFVEQMPVIVADSVEEMERKVREQISSLGEVENYVLAKAYIARVIILKTSETCD